MRGELDDALARLRRWDEVRQRLAGESTQAPTPPAPAVPEPAQPPPAVPVSAPPRGPSQAAQPDVSPPQVVGEMLAAIADVAQRYGRVAVTVVVDNADSSWLAQVVPGEDGRAVVNRLEPRAIGTDGGQNPPSWPPAGGKVRDAGRLRESIKPLEPIRPSEPPERTASRLAELVRRDPSLLEPPGDSRQ